MRLVRVPRVLFLDQFSDLGGAQCCLLDLMPAVLAKGWTPQVLLPGPGRFQERLASLGVESALIACGPYTAGRKSVGDIVRFGGDLSSQVRTIRPYAADLLYVNGPRLLPAAAYSGLPVLFHAHNYLSAAYAQHAADWSIRASGATVVACCRFVAPGAARKLHVIANGTPDMNYKLRTFERGSLRIGIIGKLCRQKGQEDFLRAAALVAQTLPGTQFIVCGEGDGEGLQKLASGLKVTFLGWRDDVAAVLAGLDLLVIASQQEGLPRVMLEAFSAGVPVVAYPAGGIPEAIVDGETGFLMPQSTPEALAARICGLPENLPEVAAAARQVWEQRYTLTNYQTRILEAMEEARAATPRR